MENTNSQFDIKIITEDDLLLVFAVGNYSLTKANHLFKFAIDNGVLHSKSKILINVTNITGTIPTFERYQFSEFLANYRMNHASGRVNKIAVVGQEPIIDGEKFGETVAINRGANVRVFTDISKASIWLEIK